jgi:hypothetical protein
MHMCNMMMGPAVIALHGFYYYYGIIQTPTWRTTYQIVRVASGARKRSKTACYILAWFDLRGYSSLYFWGFFLLIQTNTVAVASQGASRGTFGPLGVTNAMVSL